MAAKPDREIVDALKKVTDYDASVVKSMATAGVLVSIPEHWSVLFEKTPADMAYVLLEGQVEIRKEGEAVATLDPGAIFGEIALVNRTLRSASVVALTPIKAVRLDAAALKHILDENPAFADSLQHTADERSGR